MGSPSIFENQSVRFTDAILQNLKSCKSRFRQSKRILRMIDDKLTYQIIGCAIKVHKTLGNGFQEVIYQRCLAIEMESAGFSFDREIERPIFYRGVKVVGTLRVP